MELLVDEAQVEAHFSRFGDSAILTQDRCTVCARCTIVSEIVLDAPMVLLGDKDQVEAQFGSVGDSANLDAR